MMHRISIVPKKTEVRRRCLHSRQPFDNRVGINTSRWVAIFRNAPHALDGGILGDEPLHRFHVRTILAERHRYHADAVLLADPEMPVIAGYGAQECNLPLL